MNKKKLNAIALNVMWGVIATAAGIAIILAGDKLLGVQLEVFRGMQTFDALWILDLILVPLIAGFVVSLIYGLGGKMLAHAPALIAKSYAYFSLTPDMITDGQLIPLGFWVLICIVVVEACAAGGLLGEYMIKKTYGRRPKHLIHKRYQNNSVDSIKS